MSRQPDDMDDYPEPLRCLVSGNPCGTDTVMVGADPDCPACEAFARIEALEATITRLGSEEKLCRVSVDHIDFLFDDREAMKQYARAALKQGAV